MSITKISPSVVDFDSGITISTADNLDTLTLTSTDADASVGPTLALYRNSSSPADSDIIGSIDFDGRNDNSQDVQYSRIISQIVDASDGTEDATLYIQTIAGGTNQDRITIKSSETVFNEDSSDIDFRVESDNLANALFVQGSDGRVGFNTNSPAYGLLDIRQTGTGVQDRAMYIDCTPASSGSNANAVLISAGNGNMTNTVVRIHHESPAANQKLLSLDTTGSNTEKFWVDEDGDALLTGGLFLGGSADANKLDDYEEGTWTPTLLGCDSVDFSSQQGMYVKVGAMVHVQWYSSAFTVTNPETNNARIHSLPFTPKSGKYAAASFAHTTAFTNAAVQGWTNSSTPQVYVSYEGYTGGNNWSSGSSKYVMMSVVYYTDD